MPPESESIRGPAKTKSELVKTLADVVTPQRLDKLLLLLDVEVRLITPVHSAIADSTDSDSGQREAAYQLTHDYLVSAIRAWLTASQRRRASGRARLRLKELAETWNARPSPQRLPLVLEWLSIRTLTRPAEWTAPERRLMQAAGRRIIRRTAMVVGALLLVALGLGLAARQQRAEALYARLLAADTSEVPAIVGELAGYPGWAEKKLRLEEKTDLPATSEQGALAFRRKLHKQLALAASDPAAAAFVVQHLDQVAPEHLAAVIELLKPEAPR